MLQADKVLKERNRLFKDTLNVQNNVKQNDFTFSPLTRTKVKFRKRKSLLNNSYRDLTQKQLTGLSISFLDIGKTVKNILLISVAAVATITWLYNKYKDLKKGGNLNLFSLSNLGSSSTDYLSDSSLGTDFKYKDGTKEGIIKNKIIDEANNQGVDPAWALAIAQQESNFKPNAKSSAGAMGIFQLMPDTAKWLGVKDPWNVDQNIRGGIKYLKFLEKYYKGDKYKASAAYNRGQGNIDRDIKKGYDADTFTNRTKTKTGTIGYATSVMQHYSDYKKDLGVFTKNLTQATGNQFGGYTLKDNSVKVTQDMAEYLKQVKGTGVVTSGSEINKYHYFKDNGKYSSKHVLGTKVDIRTSDTKNAMELALRAIPFMEHPATVMVNFEYISPKLYNEALNIIKTKRPDIAKRIGKDLKVINTEPKNSSGVGHLDIEVDFNRLKLSQDNYNMSNLNVTNATNNSKTAYIPQQQTTSNQIAYVPQDNFLIKQSTSKKQNIPSIPQTKLFPRTYIPTLYEEEDSNRTFA